MGRRRSHGGESHGRPYAAGADELVLIKCDADWGCRQGRACHLRSTHLVCISAARGHATLVAYRDTGNA